MTPNSIATDRHVLVVEDNEGDIYMAKRAFSKAKVPTTLSIATDGEKAVAALKQIESGDSPRPDLVLLDINLPVMNGNEVLQFMKSEEQLRAIPVVVFSSSSAPIDVQLMYKHHANSYATKPHDVEAYFAVLENVQDYWFDTNRSIKSVN